VIDKDMEPRHHFSGLIEVQARLDKGTWYNSQNRSIQQKRTTRGVVPYAVAGR